MLAKDLFISHFNYLLGSVDIAQGESITVGAVLVDGSLIGYTLDKNEIRKFTTEGSNATIKLATRAAI